MGKGGREKKEEGRSLSSVAGEKKKKKGEVSTKLGGGKNSRCPPRVTRGK